jgi:hypothetical protein
MNAPRHASQIAYIDGPEYSGGANDGEKGVFWNTRELHVRSRVNRSHRSRSMAQMKRRRRSRRGRPFAGADLPLRPATVVRKSEILRMGTCIDLPTSTSRNSVLGRK